MRFATKMVAVISLRLPRSLMKNLNSYGILLNLKLGQDWEAKQCESQQIIPKH